MNLDIVCSISHSEDFGFTISLIASQCDVTTITESHIFNSDLKVMHLIRQNMILRVSSLHDFMIAF